MEFSKRKINDILLNHFPIVLNYIILDYLTIDHKFELIEESDDLYIEYHRPFCVDDNNVYSYSHSFHDKSIEVHTLKKKYLKLFESDRMRVYKNNVYLAHDEHISVFDKTGKFVKKIQFDQRYEFIKHMVIFTDKIFVCFSAKYDLLIIDIHTEIIKKVVLNSPFYRMFTNGTFLYILNIDETINEYSSDGEIITTCQIIVNDRLRRIYSFCVIDYTIYVMVSNRGLYKYIDGYVEKVLGRYSIASYIVFSNNYLYIRDNGIQIYKVKTTHEFNGK